MTGCAIFSIVINNYNYERYIGAAIDSALSQDYQPVEVVVVDDGSTDGSRDVIGRYGDKVLALFQSNGGQGAAYNAGYAACHGAFVIFLDADDRLYPHAVREIVKHFHADTSKVQFDLALIDQDGQSLQRSVLNVRPDPAMFSLLLREFLFYPSPPGSGNAYTRRFLEKRMPLPSDCWQINADSFLILAAPVDGTVVHIDKCLGNYRRHGSGATDQSREGGLVAYIRKEHQKMAAARDYTAGLIGVSSAESRRANHASPPTYLKLTAAELFLCRPAAASFSVRFGLIREATRTAAGWTPWPLSKRLILPIWTLIACVLPRRGRERFLAVSLAHSGY
jgi:Glycosyl transferase family 2